MVCAVLPCVTYCCVFCSTISHGYAFGFFLIAPTLNPFWDCDDISMSDTWLAFPYSLRNPLWGAITRACLFVLCRSAKKRQHASPKARCQKTKRCQSLNPKPRQHHMFASYEIGTSCPSLTAIKRYDLDESADVLLMDHLNYAPYVEYLLSFGYNI